MCRYRNNQYTDDSTAFTVRRTFICRTGILITSVCYGVLLCLFLFHDGKAIAQDEPQPVKLRIKTFDIKTPNQYSVSIPNFEFHVLMQKSFDRFRSTVSADYDYRRKDMGFGMSHSLHGFPVNPGVSIEDNLYFREIFSDSTGIWYRKQTITPFLVHELNDDSRISMEFCFAKEWSPRMRMEPEDISIISYYDRSIRIMYVYKNNVNTDWDKSLFFVSLERSYKILNGSYNYFLFETQFYYAREINHYLRYKGNVSFHGNLTPQKSPLFFIGGNSSLIGYENDEFWGRRALNNQNLFEFKPFPKFSFSVSRMQFRKISLLGEIDFGKVMGSAHFEDLKQQNKDLKIGLGAGFGINTDLPYMPNTNLYFMVACPSTDFSNSKFYASFGGWFNQ